MMRGTSNHNNVCGDCVRYMRAFSVRLRILRRKKGFTLDRLAQLSGLSKGYISKIERDMCEPTISTVTGLGKALGVSVGKLLGEDSDEEGVCLVRKNDRQHLSKEAKGNSRDTFEALAAKRSIKCMEPFIMRPPMNLPEPVDLSQHAGEEFMYVIRGKVEVTMLDRKIALTPGDSLYFDATIPHKVRSFGKSRAEMLLIITD